MTSLKEARYELVEIPEAFGPVTVEVDRRKILDYAYAQDELRDWYLVDSPFGGPVGHPLVLANDLLFLFYDKYDGNTAQGLHTHERLRFHAPVRLGETVVIEGAYTEKVERRGQGYVTLEATARGEDGRVLVEHVGKEIMRTVAGEVVGKGRSAGEQRSRTVLGTVDAALPVVERAAHGLPERAGIPSRTTRFTQDQMSVFSWAGKGYANVHTSLAKAAESGLDRTIVQAQQQTGHVLANLVDVFGASWFTSGEIDMRFISPAYVGEELTTSGAVVGEQDGRLELEVWIDKADGTRTAVGWASAEISEDAARPSTLA
ncbi:MaoC/PaaZ C-terminal domain-containing protein [Homoserinibacter sp. YIM 151385]|uniref:MaoC/PaaZ C-terminal domain-containing protein n=1 Tax=Homoserinibacter sp. YIM 151385 TaxID=2985506 RepID=UPI0022EFFF7D|nr:MaoC/PaaZ C-terminal domain-containing protein [Homoserinibacter sp. YIM 151385]WBU36854.1 MaoC/PaaZ C-terminal domain-containing protein [Homoserinibacter sp. YIM 151385]